MPIVYNPTDKPLPRPAAFTRDEAKQLAALEPRFHLEAPEAIYDQGKQVGVAEPLTQKEHALVESLRARRADERVIKWGPCAYRFKPYGETGCAYDMPENQAALILKQNRALKVLSDHEDLPPKVRILRSNARIVAQAFQDGGGLAVEMVAQHDGATTLGTSVPGPPILPSAIGPTLPPNVGRPSAG